MTFDAGILEHPARAQPAAADPRIAVAWMWLCMVDGLSQIADIGNDPVGQALASAGLPKHVHLKRPAGLSRDD